MIITMHWPSRNQNIKKEITQAATAWMQNVSVNWIDLGRKEIIKMNAVALKYVYVTISDNLFVCHIYKRLERPGFQFDTETANIQVSTSRPRL